MNFFKRVVSAVAAAAVLAGSAVPVSAAGSSFKLLTQEMDGQFNNVSTGGLYVVTNDDGHISNFAAISQSDVKKWRNGDKLVINDVDVDGNISWNSLDFFTDIPELCNTDSQGNITKRYAYTFDGEDTLKITQSTTKFIWPNNYGSVIQESDCDEKGNMTYSFLTPKGKKSTTKFKIGENPLNGEPWYDSRCFDDSNYVGYLTYIDPEISPKGTVYDKNAVDVGFVIKLLDINGKSKTVWRNRAYYFEYNAIAGNSIIFSYKQSGKLNTCMYDPKKDKLITFSSNKVASDNIAYKKSDGTLSKKQSCEISYISGRYSNICIACYYSYDGSSLYRLIDVSSDKGIGISDGYKSIESCDGKIFLVKTYDDKWGYINAKGKLLGTFDDAGTFDGKYAPVIKNGKAYLIDRNLKCVSEKISATSVRTLNDGLYYVENGSKKYLMTYSSSSSTSTATRPSVTKPSADSKNISGLEFYKIDNEEYTGGKLCPDPSIYDGNYLLEEKTDYTLSYRNNVSLGTGTVIVKGCGKYSGSKTLKFSIVLKTPSISAKKSGSSKAELSWKKVPGASGYEIYYSTETGSFKKLTSVSASQLRRTVSGLDFKNNSYKFKIRASASANGKTVYSSWSRTVSLG